VHPSLPKEPNGNRTQYERSDTWAAYEAGGDKGKQREDSNQHEGSFAFAMNADFVAIGLALDAILLV